ncbi:MAG: type II secretion system F family protein [Planctomycetota bacterium]|nr:MAG: type II secretion system F family protein [Planctomycetota bacterium]
MPDYKYQAKTADGKKVAGTLTAMNEGEAVGELRRQNLIVISLSERGAKAKKEKSGGGGFFSLQFGGKKSPKARVKPKDLVVFTRQLATMISAGIPLLEGLEILSEQAEDPGFKLVLTAIVESVRSGSDFSESLGMHPKIFEDIYVNMIRAGEASGQLDVILDRLSEYMEAAEKLKREIKSAMTYPVVSLIMVFGITIFLLVFIVPKFAEIFDQIGGRDKMPMPTKILIAISEFMQHNWYIWVPAFIGLIVVAVAYSKTEKGGYVVDWLKLNIPVFGPLFRKIAISRFARTFATLIRSGVPILGALEIVAHTAGNRIVRDAVLSASESVRQGEPLGAPLAKSKVFPPMVTRMISIGERSGSLEALLEKISEFYESEVSATVDALTSLIEPLMIGLMGFMVGGIVMAVFLPIFKMSSQMGSH